MQITFLNYIFLGLTQACRIGGPIVLYFVALRVFFNLNVTYLPKKPVQIVADILDISVKN